MTAQVHFCPVCRQSNDPHAIECVACDTPVPESGWPMDPHIGKVLGGKYRVESRLGAGGFGTVLLATQLHGEQDLGHVVLKILHADMAQQDNVRRRFVNEARAARKLGSPHAVKVFDLSYDGNASGSIPAPDMEDPVGYPVPQVTIVTDETTTQNLTFTMRLP